jgi:hypothetical protein
MIGDRASGRSDESDSPPHAASIIQVSCDTPLFAAGSFINMQEVFMSFKGFRIACLAIVLVAAFVRPAGTRAASSTHDDGFGIICSECNDEYPVTAYNSQDNEFLVVGLMSKDSLGGGARDVYGQFVLPDGTLKGGRFPICMHPADQSCPDVAYNPINNEYLVVWCDFRAPEGDIFGARLDASGMKLANENNQPDTVFTICTQDSTQLNPRIAHNPVDNNFLVVWRDYRNSFVPVLGKRGSPAASGSSGPSERITGFSYPSSSNLDLYGERLDNRGMALTPGNPANTDVNYPIAVDHQYDEFFQDVTYCGGGDRPDEWLVTYVFYSLEYELPASELVHGIRIDGKTGHWIDTWGSLIAPTLVQDDAIPTAPPWGPDFPVGSASYQPSQEPGVTQVSPRVESNTGWLLHTGAAQARNPNPLAECFVVWVEFPAPSQIRGQRLGYFPDSTAVRRGFKPSRGTDGMFTLVPLDSTGRPVGTSDGWITWKSLRLTQDDTQHDFTNISYNPVWGEYLAVWNDWTSTTWNGTYLDQDMNPLHVPQADMAGRRLFLNPADSSIMFLDENGDPCNTASSPIFLTGTEEDEGNNFFPAPAYGYQGDQFLITYEWEADNNDKQIDIQGVMFHGGQTAVGDCRNRAIVPSEHLLASNYPNPFNPGTTIDFRISAAERTTVRIFDTMGREVAGLMDRHCQPGSYRVEWNGSDAAGNPAASGVYLYKIESGSYSTMGRMLLLR